MLNGESPSNCEPSKKRKVDDADGSEDDSECEDMNRSFCIYTNTDDFDSSKWICENIPFTEYLKRYEPETKVSKVNSFLVLGELCQNLRTYTQLIQDYGESWFIRNDETEEDQFDVKIFEIFREKLKVIQDICLRKAQEALEKWQMDGNANLVFKDLFLGDWKEADSIGRLEKHEVVDKESLNKTYAKLAPIYVSLRDIEHGAYCDQHRGSMWEPGEEEVDEINQKMKEFQLEDFWAKK